MYRYLPIVFESFELDRDLDGHVFVHARARLAASAEPDEHKALYYARWFDHIAGLTFEDDYRRPILSIMESYAVDKPILAIYEDLLAKIRNGQDAYTASVAEWSRIRDVVRLIYKLERMKGGENGKNKD